MKGISGFTFIHNGVEGGYPFLEAIEAIYTNVNEVVVVDMESTDETRMVLEEVRESAVVPIRILDGTWTPGAAGACLAANHLRHVECEYDTIWHFEADEIFSQSLVEDIVWLLEHNDFINVLVYRLQVEQNFQRCRWYPEPVHRVFKKGTVMKEGHTTDMHRRAYYDGEGAATIDPISGFLWDVTNCFRDSWRKRCENQAELWGESPQYKSVGLHANHGFTIHPDIGMFLLQPHWTWTKSPFDLPNSLKRLVGVTSYREHLVEQGYLDG